ncbi:hypothetical protein K3495_g4684 [Podosphaera aphanis]|nr:hypothetical protein K3495_g4684 [Podosphaera aphanis]
MSSSIFIHILTFNCAKSPIDVDTFSSLLPSGTRAISRPPDILVISLQEIAPIHCSFIGGSFLATYLTPIYDAVQNSIVTETLSDTQPYLHIVTHNLGSTALVIFAKDASAITDVETAGVGLGIWGLGNKGAAGLRFRYHGALLTFAAVHLAAMEWRMQSRNEDWKKIVRRLVFNPVEENETSEEAPLLAMNSKESSIYRPDSHLFVAGDLNYRTSPLPPTPIDYLSGFPQPHQSPSDKRHFLKLLESDQLNLARRAKQTCHGLVEPEITFPPTYKYTIGCKGSIAMDERDKKWNWAAHRWPSWCDRILYLDTPKWLAKRSSAAKIKVLKYDALSRQPTSDHLPVLLELEVPLLEIPEPSNDEETDDPRIHPPFEIDPNWKDQYTKARILEYAIGWVVWLTTTWGGCGVVLLSILVMTTVGRVL